MWMKFLMLEKFYNQFLGLKKILGNYENSVEKENK